MRSPAWKRAHPKGKRKNTNKKRITTIGGKHVRIKVCPKCRKLVKINELKKHLTTIAQQMTKQTTKLTNEETLQYLQYTANIGTEKTIEEQNQILGAITARLNTKNKYTINEAEQIVENIQKFPTKDKLKEQLTIILNQINNDRLNEQTSESAQSLKASRNILKNQMNTQEEGGRKTQHKLSAFIKEKQPVITPEIDQTIKRYKLHQIPTIKNRIKAHLDNKDALKYITHMDQQIDYKTQELTDTLEKTTKELPDKIKAQIEEIKQNINNYD